MLRDGFHLFLSLLSFSLFLMFRLCRVVERLPCWHNNEKQAVFNACKRINVSKIVWRCPAATVPTSIWTRVIAWFTLSHEQTMSGHIWIAKQFQLYTGWTFNWLLDVSTKYLHNTGTVRRFKFEAALSNREPSRNFSALLCLRCCSSGKSFCPT